MHAGGGINRLGESARGLHAGDAGGLAYAEALGVFFVDTYRLVTELPQDFRIPHRLRIPLPGNRDPKEPFLLAIFLPFRREVRKISEGRLISSQNCGNPDFPKE